LLGLHLLRYITRLLACIGSTCKRALGWANSTEL